MGELGEVQFGDIRSLYPKLIGNTIQQIYNETTHHNRKILLFESFYIGSHLHGGLWVEGRQPHSPIGMFLSFSISGQSLLGYNLSIDHPTSYSFIKVELYIYIYIGECTKPIITNKLQAFNLIII